jgi:hypothetical protein
MGVLYLWGFREIFGARVGPCRAKQEDVELFGKQSVKYLRDHISASIFERSKQKTNLLSFDS